MNKELARVLKKSREQWQARAETGEFCLHKCFMCEYVTGKLMQGKAVVDCDAFCPVFKVFGVSCVAIRYADTDVEDTILRDRFTAASVTHNYSKAKHYATLILSLIDYMIAENKAGRL